jgi:activator of 2-hydroxyglutaryl-CoA dehydratase
MRKIATARDFGRHASWPPASRTQAMKGKTAAIKLSSQARSGARECVLGVDGGGTKTHAVVADEHGRVLGEGLAGPSNPLRVGVANAAAAVREAIDRAAAD